MYVCVCVCACTGASIPIPCSGRPMKNRDNTIRATTTIINRRCSNYTTFGQLFLRKVIEIDATRYLDFSSKCVWRPGSARTRWGSLQRSPRPLSWIQGVLYFQGEGKGKRRGRIRGGGGMRPILYPDLGDRSPCVYTLHSCSTQHNICMYFLGRASGV